MFIRVLTLILVCYAAVVVLGSCSLLLFDGPWP